MGNSMQVLAQQFFDKASIEDCSLEELRHVAKRHPYFAPVQFLLVHKLQETTEGQQKQKARAVLFYPDPLAFEAFISTDGFVGDQQQSIDIPEETISTDITPAGAQHDHNDEVELSKTDSYEASDVASINNEAASSIEHPIEEVKPVELISETTTLGETKELDSAVTNTEVSRAYAELKQMPLDKKEGTVNTILNEVKPLPELTFEPFHTVDYFASQGIKMSLEDGPKDKLGKGLKSFTEWLRTMKRLPGNQLPLENVAERRVENMASHSVADSNIVTEAMADVWAKQGNHEKALAIYHKLSLLYPSKKVYFAAKIDQLKTS